MTRSCTRLTALALVAIAAAALPAASIGSGAGPHKRGGTFKMISSGDVDYVDPGQAYYSFSFQILKPVHRALYTIPADKLTAVPDLAAGQPKVSKDGRTITVTIKRGIRYSPPLSREVVAADVKYAV